MIWTPHATVAAIVEREGRFLLVEELSSRGDRVFNQPAGHVEEDESVVAATKRETLEESGWHIEVSSLVGIYTYKAPSNGITYYRLCYACEALSELENPQLDEGIIAAHWLTMDEILARKAQLRSPLVLKCFEDYLTGKRYPLDILYEHPDE